MRLETRRLYCKCGLSSQVLGPAGCWKIRSPAHAFAEAGITAES
jgi:hypothetical protein